MSFRILATVCALIGTLLTLQLSHASFTAVSRALAVVVKTMYLYSMDSRLVNVRLDAERARKVQRLRERGVTLSAVVREAIDERFASLGQSAARRDVQAIITRIFEQHPDPPDLPARRAASRLWTS
jgi:hypothetical protein